MSIFRFPILAGQAACRRHRATGVGCPVPLEAVGHLSIPPQCRFARVAGLDRAGGPGLNTAPTGAASFRWFPCSPRSVEARCSIGPFLGPPDARDRDGTGDHTPIVSF
ncbi:hypothetical protein GCM10010259_30550 [Streptomyces daghestanicus]|uniref:Uncharacterized protein n=1 Tax=Streptomyces griseoviridis TaxID=45398 RepID=A0A918G6U7_STRGD|nr:hypothetical protein GCM10010238_06820 [Streptomyces niveoruber]GGS74809.1 hypothetical protein GCM10010240_04870 [Streptomyces griseoviridis]GGU37776.1 hypothetical protein GCM10010259_30550 [Streptomyces daghestanicus]